MPSIDPLRWTSRMRPQNKADEFNPAFILGQVWANAQHVARQAFRRSTRQFASPPVRLASIGAIFRRAEAKAPARLAIPRVRRRPTSRSNRLTARHPQKPPGDLPNIVRRSGLPVGKRIPAPPDSLSRGRCRKEMSSRIRGSGPCLPLQPPQTRPGETRISSKQRSVVYGWLLAHSSTFRTILAAPLPGA